MVAVSCLLRGVLLMGCVSSKRVDDGDYDGPLPHQGVIIGRSSSRWFLSSSRRSGMVALDEALRVDSCNSRLIPAENGVIVSPVARLPEERKEEVATEVNWVHRTAAPAFTLETDAGEGLENGGGRHARVVVSVPDGFSGEHVAAGWPPWLVKVAPEAVKGWVPRKSDSFERLDKIGEGTYSNVYKARDLQTGKLVALKKVRFASMDPESVRFMAREIHILRVLDHPNVMRLEGLVTSRMSSSLYLVFEYMEHDLTGLSANHDIKFSEPQIKCYMQQLLHGLDHCHRRGVLHRDIKGSNLLIDNKGILKIADFGLATFFSNFQKHPLTSRVVTLWYRPPELLLGATDYDISVDLWSAGCILAEMFAGKPILPGRTEVEQLHKIFKLCGSPSEEYWKKSKLPHATVFKPQQPYHCCIGETFKGFPPSALALLESLLAIEPENRGTAASALGSRFFSSKPVACDPASLPKYPPSKEYGIKLQDADSKRQKANANVPGFEYGRKAAKAIDGDAENQASLQRKQIQTNAKPNDTKHHLQDQNGPGFPIEPLPRLISNNGSTRSGPLVQPGNLGSTWNELRKNSGDYTFSTSRASNGSQTRMKKPQHSHQEDMEISNVPRFIALKDGSSPRYNRLDVAEPYKKLLDNPSSHKHDREVASKGPTKMKQGNGAKGNGAKNRIHFSGPLMPPGSNMEEMLKEHERQIQQAVRRAQQRTAAARRCGDPRPCPSPAAVGISALASEEPR